MKYPTFEPIKINENIDLKKIEDKWLEDFNASKKPISLVDRIIEHEIDTLYCKQANEAEILVKKKLSELGFYFETSSGFLMFVQSRITRVYSEEDPFRYFLFLDYIDEENPGILLLTFSTKINLESDLKTGFINISIG